MPYKRLTRFLLLPELKFLEAVPRGRTGTLLHCRKESDFEVCPKCATKSYSVHDKRVITIKDCPVRGKDYVFKIVKRRFRCPKCKSVFTEPVPGIKKGFRTTQRFKSGILWACDYFSDLKKVRKEFNCGSKTVYKALYEKLRLKQSERQNPWPKTLGIDEHFFSRCKKSGHGEFATIFVDYSNKRVKDVVKGKSHTDLLNGIGHIEGRENVLNVCIDLSDSYKSFVKEFFPNAKIIADKFHVLRLLVPQINMRRKQITGDKRKNPIRRLLLCSSEKLEYFKRNAIHEWLKSYPELREVYAYKEWMHTLYRCKGLKKASICLTKMTDSMALSQLPEIKKLRKTLMKWRREILLYFETKLTNARTEGFNNIAKLVQKRAFGYKSFENYRLRLLHACS